MYPVIHCNTADVSSREMEQLWIAACTLVNQNLLKQAVICLELCCNDALNTRTLEVNILLAEICLTLCATESKQSNRDLWHKRYKRAHQSISDVERILHIDARVIEPELHARLLKCKYLITKLSKVDHLIKNRQLIEDLCHAIHVCSTMSKQVVGIYRAYFCKELRISLSQMHGEHMLKQYEQKGYEDNLKYVRNEVARSIDPVFQFWLVDVSCHALCTNMQFGTAAEVVKAIAFADEWIGKHELISTEARIYHLIVKSFYLARTGQFKAMGVLVDEIKLLRTNAGSEGKQNAGLMCESFLDCTIDGLNLAVVRRYDPCQAIEASMTAIHRVQSYLQEYTLTRPEVHLFLLGVLFDMLYIHCDLHLQQSRFYEMAVSISQTLQLFSAYKAHLEPTFLYNFYLGQLHILIAKYAVAIGKYPEGESHLSYIVQRFLLPLPPNDQSIVLSSYSLLQLRLWVDVLEVSTYCSSIADSAFTLRSSTSNDVQMKPACPIVPQLAFAGQILGIKCLRTMVYESNNTELKSRYDLALCKWLWATQELGLVGNIPIEVRHASYVTFQRYQDVEADRPQLMILLHSALEQVSAHVNCTDSSAEIMALLGPALIGSGRVEQGEETLKSALRLSLHSKNILLQSRLLVEVFRLYTNRQFVQALTTSVEKFEKKVTQLQHRLKKAREDTNINRLILGWSATAAS